MSNATVLALWPRWSGMPRLTCLLVLSSMLVSTGIGAQGFDPDRTHPAEALREDFALLRRALEEAHAGLYRYSSKAAIDRMFGDAAARLRAPMTELEFLRVLGPVVGGVNDGHTGWSPSQGMSRYLDSQPILLPFGLRFVDGRAYLFQNLSDEPALEMGAELTHVNGLAMGDVVVRLLPFISSDGRVVISKYRRALENTSAFSRLYGIVFGVTTRFELTYRPMGGGAPETVTVQGITTAQLRQRLAERYPQTVAAQSRPPIEFTWRDGVPILTVRTFGGGLYGRAGIDYAGFLRDAFAELAERGAEHLIIDVRGNGGGSDDYGKLLAAHLLDYAFDYYAALEINAPSFGFMEYTDQPQWSMPEARVRANARGVYDVLGHPNLGPQQPAEPMFGGDVIILIDGGSFSATGEFTSVIHHLGRATFVGEEGGAGYYGNTSGGGATLTLPTTGVRVRIPFIRYSCAVSGYEPTDRGLIPDHAVTPTIEDLLADRDPALEFALELARRR